MLNKLGYPWQVDVIEIRPYTRFNRDYHYFLTVIDKLSKHSWTAQIQERKQGDEGDCKDNLRRRKMPEKFAD